MHFIYKTLFYPEKNRLSSVQKKPRPHFYFFLNVNLELVKIILELIYYFSFFSQWTGK